jgi:guanylate kinase
MPASGNLYVVAAPSGAGKTSLVKALVDIMQHHVTVSISHTTRPKRPQETEGINYYFVDESEFNHMIEQNAFLEHATVFGHSYGTSRAWVEKTLANGLDVILEIDWQGCQQIKQLFPDCISIFIIPPSVADLSDRLHKRNQDNPDVIQLRLADAKEVVSHVSEFDYVVVNDQFDHALHDLKTIMEAGRLLQKNQIIKYANLVKSFLL